MVRKQNQKQKIGSKKAVFKFVSNAANRGIIKKKKKNIPISKNPKTMYGLPIFSFKAPEDYYNQYPKGSRKEKKLLKQIKEEAKEVKTLKKHYRQEKLTKKEVRKLYKLTDVEHRVFKEKIRSGKRKGKFRYKEIKRIEIPTKQYYGSEKIITNKGDIFYLKFQTEQEKKKAIEILLQHYDFDYFKVLGLDINSYKDLRTGDKHTYIAKNTRFLSKDLKHHNKHYRPLIITHKKQKKK